MGKTSILTQEQKEYVPSEEIINEIREFFHDVQLIDSSITRDIDYLTFSGRGEPTLASNLGEMIRGIRKIRDEKIAVITNSTTLHLADTQSDLLLADLVVAKLDACDELSFSQIDKAMVGISFESALRGIKNFKKNYQGKLAIQIMFVEENRKYALRIADIVREINADEIQINTPVRPSAAHPIDRNGMLAIKELFNGMPTLSFYDSSCKETVPYNIKDTIKRHGNYKSTLSVS
ncbi:MAG: radical SAM protein [Candidatus Omnitrophica bacterium]|nr:radical SAM protein [Candidatus Omnitrophota bacterium]